MLSLKYKVPVQTRLSKSYTKGDTLEVKIEKVVPRGFGLGFTENLTVLVPLAAPHDVLKVRIRDLKKHTAFAEIVEIVHSGPRRIVPPCPYYGACGGCNLQHLDYEAQLAAKVGIIQDCLRRIGKIELDGEIAVIPSPNHFEYRSRARWHVDRQTRAIGYHRRDSSEVIDISTCPILTPEMQGKLDQLRAGLNWDLLWSDESEIEAASGEGGQVSTFSAEFSERPAELSIDLAGENYSYTAETFFQGNRSLVEKLVATAIGAASGGTALDLYCGVGLFALPLARRFRKVTGVEENGLAVHFAKKNGRNAGLQNLNFVSKSVETFLLTDKKKKKLDFVLLDPPRSGTEKRTIPAIIDLRPERISYVSCEPSILARDLRVFIDARYKIASMTALDLFPQTHHIETVVHLENL